MSQIEVSFRVYRGSESGKIVADKTTRILGPNDVFIRIAHSGVCGTDEHFLHSGCVLGHEGVGYVEETGPDVRRVKKEDRVGFGFVHKVCGNCEYCLNGKTRCLHDPMHFRSIVANKINDRARAILFRGEKVRQSRP
jgi:D-arabinose 1-dehydrogenase-like Zn-dependent alcohol dehydrogenase